MDKPTLNEISGDEPARYSIFVPPPRPEKVSENVARQLIVRMSSDELGTSQRLPSEALLQGLLKVSRSSLREALRILEVFGLVTLRIGRGGGPMILKPTTQDVGRVLATYFHVAGLTYGELLGARRLIEPFFAAEAALKRDPIVLAELSEICAAGSQTEGSDSSRWRASTTDFHTVLAGTENRILCLLALAIKDIYDKKVSSVPFDLSHRQQIRDEHDLILSAIDRQQPDEAARLMREHLDDAFAYITQRLPDLSTSKIDLW